MHLIGSSPFQFTCRLFKMFWKKIMEVMPFYQYVARVSRRSKSVSRRLCVRMLFMMMLPGATSSMMMRIVLVMTMMLMMTMMIMMMVVMMMMLLLPRATRPILNSIRMWEEVA